MPDVLPRSIATDVAFASPGGGLTLQRRKGLRLVEIVASREASLQAGSPAAFPTRPNLAVVTGSGATLWLGPNRYLGVEPESSPVEAMGALPGVYLTDVSHARFVLRAAGAHVREFLAKSCPLDLHVRAFPQGACAQSLVADVPMLLHAFDDAGFDLFIERSLARSAVALLVEQAEEFSNPNCAHPRIFGMNESVA